MEDQAYIDACNKSLQDSINEELDGRARIRNFRCNPTINPVVYEYQVFKPGQKKGRQCAFTQPHELCVDDLVALILAP